jgi:hypothetical protein
MRSRSAIETSRASNLNQFGCSRTSGCSASTICPRRRVVLAKGGGTPLREPGESGDHRSGAPLPNGGFAVYGSEPKRTRKLTKRYVSRMQAPKPQSPRQIRIPQVGRTRRVARRVARTTGSRGDPEPEPEPAAARFDGFAVASRRMHEHLCRRMGARKAAAA